jgi:hypothetical protein
MTHYLKSINTFLFEHIRPIVYQILNYGIAFDTFIKYILFFTDNTELKEVIIETYQEIDLHNFTNINPIPYEYIAIKIKEFLTNLDSQILLTKKVGSLEIKDILNNII